MQEIISEGLWSKIRKLAKSGNQRLAAIAYVSSADLIPWKKGDLLALDASDHAIKSGATSAKALKTLLGKGVDLVNVPGLHAKVMVCGDAAIIGSANLSATSAEKLVEAALVSDHRSIVSAAKSLIFQVAQSGQTIDQKFVKRVLRIPVSRRQPMGGNRKRDVAVKPTGNRTWVVNVKILDDDAFPNEQDLWATGQEKAEKLRTWRSSAVLSLRWTGSDTFYKKAVPGDSVIQVEEDRAGKIRVIRHSPILYRQKESATRSRFFLEETTTAQTAAISLGKLNILLKACGDTRTVTQRTCRSLDPLVSDALYQKWKRLK